MNNSLHEQLKNIENLKAEINVLEKESEHELGCLNELVHGLCEGMEEVSPDMLHNLMLANSYLNEKFMKLDLAMSKIESCLRGIYQELFSEYQGRESTAQMFFFYLHHLKMLDARSLSWPPGGEYIALAVNAAFIEDLSGEFRYSREFAAMEMDKCSATIDAVIHHRYYLAICDYRFMVYYLNEVIKIADAARKAGAPIEIGATNV